MHDIRLEQRRDSLTSGAAFPPDRNSSWTYSGSRTPEGTIVDLKRRNNALEGYY